MSKILEQKILQCLGQLEGTGNFACTGKTDFMIPGMEVKTVGEISFPLSAEQARLLIQVSQQAPYGKGSDTIVDTNVRNTWEIDGESIFLKNDKWYKTIALILEKIKQDLGIENYKIKANLYKLLIYEEGGFFKRHKDTEKEKGMFGTMVVNMPSSFTGGELEIFFDNKTLIFEPHKANPYDIHYAAFYADCDHEVKPVTAGYRIALIYNLIQEESAHAIRMQSESVHVNELAQYFLEWKEEKPEDPMIILMDHQYTETNFSYKNLKLHDRYRAEIISKAAEKADLYKALCLITSQVVGVPDGYDEDSDVMDEVIDEEIYLDNWVEDQLPELRFPSINKEKFLTSIDLDEEEPIDIENSGFMGNYGPELTYWYHYGSMVLWSKEMNARFLMNQNMDTRIKWIRHFIHSQSISDLEKKAIENIMQLGSDRSAREKCDMSPIFDWACYTKNPQLLLQLETYVLETYFNHSRAEAIFPFVFGLDENQRDTFLAGILAGSDIATLQNILALLVLSMKNKELQGFTNSILDRLPDFAKIVLSSQNVRLNSQSYKHLFEISLKADRSGTFWENIIGSIFLHATNVYIRDVISSQLLESKNKSLFYDLLHGATVYYLKEKTAYKPEPPADWVREISQTPGYKQQWDILRPFMNSPTQSAFEYKRAQKEREMMINAIRSTKVDLRYEIIRQGSPHTLKIIKTQANYENELSEWRENMALLKKLL